MNIFRRFTASVLPLLLLLLFSVSTEAALKAVGPTDPVTTLPTYYQDLTNIALQPCLDQNGMCLLPGGFDKLGNPIVPNFDPAFSPPLPLAAIATSAPINNSNFPDEGFYYSAVAIMPIEGGELANLAYVLEYAFLAGVSPNAAIVFLRTDLQKMINLTPDSTYRVTHPYGTFDFTTDNAGNARGGGGVVLRLEDPPGGAGVAVGYFSPAFKSAPDTNIGPFLRPADGILITKAAGAETHTYLGDPAATTLVNGVPTAGVPVTGGTNGNIFKIDRIVTGGIPVSQQSSWQTNLFSIAARVFTGTVASPMTIDRATYSRDAATGQVDIFVTAVSGATLTVNGTGIPTTTLTEDVPGSGKFFAHIPFSTTLPSALTITNSLDLPSPVAHPFALSDEVIISKALYDPVSKNLTVMAVSRDKLVVPTLTVPQFAAPNTLTSGTLVKSLSATIPPETVTVTSSNLGTATAPVSVVIPPPPPVAVNDDAVTTMTTPVTINVLANDTADGGVNSATVTVVTPSSNGATATVNANGTITYTPAAAFNGSDSFTYRFSDNFDQLSNTATVTITVHVPPVAGNDTASAAINTTVNIDVIANDTAFSSSINSTTVNIVSAATCGSTSILPNGTVNFTAPSSIPSGPGTCTFSYVVSDTFVPATISNVATVTVTITPPPAPVAGDDAAATVTGSPVIVNVVANDTSAVSTINPATLAVNAPTGGTATANLNGTVTYTPPATPGSYTFTYTVKDNTVSASTSNAATVTVTVTQGPIAPVAVNDPATPLSISMNTSTVINVIGNDTASSPATINPATLAIAGFPANGTVATHANGTVTYTPSAGYIGSDSFSYTVKDSLALQSNIATVTITVAVPPAASGVTVTEFPTSPQLPGAQILFTASGSGSSGSYEYEFWLFNGTTWSKERPYSTVPTWSWNTSGLSAGAYTIAANVRVVGSTAANEAVSYLQYNLTTPVTTVILTPNVASPQLPGTTVTFGAAASGGSGTYEYRFWVYDGTSWTLGQNYSPLPTFTWNTSSLAAGNYQIAVDVRNTASPAEREAVFYLVYALTTPVASVTVISDQPTPHPAGTQVTFAATGVNGSGTYEYEFYFFNGSTWSLVKPYSGTSTWTLPGNTAAGNYIIAVNARNAGASNARDAVIYVPYVVQ